MLSVRNPGNTAVRLILKDVNDNAPEMPIKAEYELDENESEVVNLKACGISSYNLIAFPFRIMLLMLSFMLLTKTIPTLQTLKSYTRFY